MQRSFLKKKKNHCLGKGTGEKSGGGGLALWGKTMDS